MTRFVVDVSAVLHLANAGIDVPTTHGLLAPTLLRSQALLALRDALHRATSRPTLRGSVSPTSRRMRIRLLGDAVLRRRALGLAEELRWA